MNGTQPIDDAESAMRDTTLPFIRRLLIYMALYLSLVASGGGCLTYSLHKTLFPPVAVSRQIRLAQISIRGSETVTAVAVILANPETTVVGQTAILDGRALGWEWRRRSADDGSLLPTEVPCILGAPPSPDRAPLWVDREAPIVRLPATGLRGENVLVERAVTDEELRRAALLQNLRASSDDFSAELLLPAWRPYARRSAPVLISCHPGRPMGAIIGEIGRTTLFVIALPVALAADIVAAPVELIVIWGIGQSLRGF